MLALNMEDKQVIKVIIFPEFWMDAQFHRELAAVASAFASY